MDPEIRIRAVVRPVHPIFSRMISVPAHQSDNRLDSFFEQLGHSAHALLILDYDGTLAPFQNDPQKAVPYPGVRDALNRVMDETDTRVVIVSGRWSRDLVPLLGLKRVPELWGIHGWERCLTDGQCETAQPPVPALQALAEADTWVSDIRARGGRAEFKPVSLAIHWRGLDPRIAEEIRSLVTSNWAMTARDRGLELHPFDGGLELRVPGRNKGDAVRTLQGEMPDAVTAYLGDDFTDEDAFTALQGNALGILVRPQTRATAAPVWLQPPDGLLEFLNRWIDVRKRLHETA